MHTSSRSHGEVVCSPPYRHLDSTFPAVVSAELQAADDRLLLLLNSKPTSPPIRNGRLSAIGQNSQAFLGHIQADLWNTALQFCVALLLALLISAGRGVTCQVRLGLKPRPRS